MIISTLISILLGIAQSIIGLLPDASATPSYFETGWNWFNGFFAGIVWMLNGAEGGDLGTHLAIALTILIIFEGAWFLWMIVRIALNLFRGSGI